MLAMGHSTQHSDSLNRSKTGTTRIVHRELFPNVLNSEGSVAEWHLQLGHLKPLIPRARLELARLIQSTDFKSGASTDSATWAKRGATTLMAVAINYSRRNSKNP
jgi:hypothetical protein